MLPQKAIDTAMQQVWVDPISDMVQAAVRTVFEAGGPVGQRVKDALHGAWLGHQLHPALTDVPLGAWTVAVVLDLMEVASRREDLAPGADAAVAVGFVGALGAAVTGLTDWSATGGETRRLGLFHGLLNTGATLLYGVALARRRRGDRAAGRRLAYLGYSLSLASAYLGGHLVYAQRLGVDHADVEGAPRDFVPVMTAADLPERQPHRVEADGVPVLLVRQAGRLYALAETCSHLGGPLAEGTLEEGAVRCPWHGSCFALDDGRVLAGPATRPQPRFEVRIRDGVIEVQIWQAGKNRTDPPLATAHQAGSDQASQSSTIDEPVAPVAHD